MRILSKFLTSKFVLLLVAPRLPSISIMAVTPTGAGTVLGQDGHLNLHILAHLEVALLQPIGKRQSLSEFKEASRLPLTMIP